MEEISLDNKRKIRTWALSQEASKLQEEKSCGSRSSPLIDLASNDYFGLSRHPKLIEAVSETIKIEGVGSGSSQLLTGTRPINKRLEEKLANWMNRESILLFPSGFQANIAAVNCLADRHTSVFADKLIHHSLLVGVKASGAKLYRFAHNDLNQLEDKLIDNDRKTLFNSPLIIVESLYSMEGTSPNLFEIKNLCEKYGALLIIDEAHALGILGDKGKGLSYKINEDYVIVSGTFGKAFGSGGAFLASNKKIREKLIQTSGAFRYTTGIAPPLCAGANAAIDLIDSNPAWGEELIQESAKWRKRFIEIGYKRPSGISHIIPLIIGDNKKSMHLQNKLEEDGILCLAIRPPTVPEGTSRLRIVIRRSLPKFSLEKLIANLEIK
tara:strand:+ start:711 stop:1856 length:1146 start_codon:yes stop_codon:yes gene_type:complete